MVKSKPKVTVLIATLNVKDTIKKCLDSVIKTDYKNKKILVVDGYSSDGTYKILKRYENKKLIKLIQASKPVNNQWNKALEKIDTDYIAFTDADCEVDKKWLTYLMKGFNKNKKIIATAGYCGTPKKTTWLQKLIGKELEARFKKFPEYISRAPTMNLCVKTKYAKKVGFRKELHTSSEVVFGWELSKLGNILYVPEAKVVHHHRATLQGFFKQQRLYAKYLFKIFFQLGYKFKGDHISNYKMILQVPLFELLIFSFFLTGPLSIILSIFSGTFLLCVYLFTFEEMQLKPKMVFTVIPFFIIRTVAWTLGSIQGLLDLIFKRGVVQNG